MIKTMCLVNEKTAIKQELDSHECGAGKEGACDCLSSRDRIRDINHLLKIERDKR